jgi:hypothetical protein
VALAASGFACLAAPAAASATVDFAPAESYSVCEHVGTEPGEPVCNPDGYAPSPESVAIADLDRDGSPDLIVANANASQLAVLLGDGTGSLGEPSYFEHSLGPSEVVVGDLNGDGLTDVATVDIWREFSSDGVSIRLGDGTGSFGSRKKILWTPDTEWGRNSIAVGELNGDDHLDLAVANGGNSSITLLLGDGTGSFAETSFDVGYRPGAIEIGDFDGDGAADLVTSGPEPDGVSIMLGDGGGTFGTPSHFVVGHAPVSIAIGHLDGDGATDLAVANQLSNDVSILLGDGAGSFERAGELPVGSVPSSVVIGDFDGDGANDVAAANHGPCPSVPPYCHFTPAPGSDNSVSVLLGDGSGGFGEATNFDVAEGPTSVAIADLDDDGAPDLVTTNDGSNSVSVLLNCSPDCPPVPEPPAGPKLTELAVAPSKFLAGPRDTPARRFGAAIRLRLSEDAVVNFHVRRARPPARRGSRKGLPRKHLGSFRRHLATGESSVRFTGTLGGRTLEPGRYRISARAINPQGDKSEKRSARFTVARP